MIQPINPENLQKRAKGRPRKEIRKTAAVTLWMEPYLKSLFQRKQIRPEDFREFIKRFKSKDPESGYEQEPSVTSNDWEKLTKIIDQSPALLIYGWVGSGKSFLMKEVIKNNPYKVFIVIDSHNEYTFLPEIKKITRDLTSSARIIPHRQIEAARRIFVLYKSIIMSEPFVNNNILVIEEASRYPEALEIAKESRKFVKTISITQTKDASWDFLPSIKVRPYKEMIKTT